MRITKINIPITSDDGLHKIEMSKLGNVVLLAGKNGSGKTRVLNKIIDFIKRKPTKSWNDKVLSRGTMEFLIGERERLEALVKKNQDYDDMRDLRGINEDIRRLEELEQWVFIETSSLDEHYPIIEFVPKVLELKDPDTLSKDDLRLSTKEISNLGFDKYPKGVFASIQYLQDRYINITHSEINVDEKIRERIIVEYLRLKEYIKKFLNTDLTRSSNGDAQLFGFKLGESRLSDGQKILLQFCLAIYSQRSRLKDLILFMDEPENHLHPSVILEVLDLISENLTYGQLWISTHSVNILAHYDPSTIWYVENGKVNYHGNMPEKVLSGLIGKEYEMERFYDFLSLPASFATNKFAFECLVEPKTIDYSKNDPQVNQIKKATEELRLERDKVKVLDLGAGKGRLLSSICETKDEDKLSYLDYIAFDLDDKDKPICTETIKKVYGSSDKRYYNSKQLLVEDNEGKSFDIIIMCNVLHEIHPSEWNELFSKNDIIEKLLKEDGILLIVEDQRIPVGEKAYNSGFIVFDEPEFKLLFNLDKDDNYKISDARGDGRLKAHYIPGNCLTRVNSESIKKALYCFHERCKDEILNLRKQNPSYKNGKLHGFWVQQYANVQLVLDDLH